MKSEIIVSGGSDASSLILYPSKLEQLKLIEFIPALTPRSEPVGIFPCFDYNITKGDYSKQYPMLADWQEAGQPVILLMALQQMATELGIQESIFGEGYSLLVHEVADCYRKLFISEAKGLAPPPRQLINYIQGYRKEQLRLSPMVGEIYRYLEERAIKGLMAYPFRVRLMSQLRYKPIHLLPEVFIGRQWVGLGVPQLLTLLVGPVDWNILAKGRFVFWCTSDQVSSVHSWSFCSVIACEEGHLILDAKPATIIGDGTIVPFNLNVDPIDLYLKFPEELIDSHV
jgi:hypothetical protein